MLTGYDTQDRGLAWLRGCLAAERAECGIAFNPLADSFWRQPEIVYKQLRKRSPVHFSRLLDCWIVTTRPEIDYALRAHEIFLSDPRRSTQARLDPFAMLDPGRPSLFMTDPPDHTRLRGVLRSAFSRSAVDRLVPRLRDCVQGSVAALGQPGDRVDLVTGFSSVVPVRALDLVTGIQTSDPLKVAGWVSAITAGLEPIATARTAERSVESYHALRAYLDDQWPAQTCRDSLVGSLHRAAESALISEAEARQLLVFTVLAGTKTVSDFLAGAARYVTAQPASSPWRHGLNAALIDELLAVLSPVQMVARTAAEPTVLGGRSIQPGQRLLLVLASANQDTEARDAATSPDQRDLTFGSGIHACPGKYFARVQALLVMSELLKTFPGVSFADGTKSRRCVTLRTWDSVIVDL